MAGPIILTAARLAPLIAKLVQKAKIYKKTKDPKLQKQIQLDADDLTTQAKNGMAVRSDSVSTKILKEKDDLGNSVIEIKKIVKDLNFPRGGNTAEQLKSLQKLKNKTYPPSSKDVF